MSESAIKIGREGVGMYWFVNTDAARNLSAARLRMREIKSLGFTEVWIAARYLEDPTFPRSALLGPVYEGFLRTVAEEADHLELLVIPFIVPCGFGEMNPPRFDLILIGSGEVSGGAVQLDLGIVPPHWPEALVPKSAWVWKTEPTDLSERTVHAGSVRELSIAPEDVSLSRDGDGTLSANVRIPNGHEVNNGDEVCVVFAGREGSPVPGLHQRAPDVTNPAFSELLKDIVRKHEEVLGGRSCYAGLAFDEPNIGDTSNDPIRKRERARRFYWSESVGAAVRERKGIDLAKRPYLLAHPDTADGYAGRVAFFEAIQECLMEAFDTALKHASVPLLGTHDWSGDRDRALYNTFDQLEFSRVRRFAATDISGIQSDFDYAPSEALHAFTQKESCGKPRAMLMTDHFREPVDQEWLLFTCERHAALGVDYMLLHAFGEITKDPPLWTRTESWLAWREPRAIEWWVARMKALSALNRFQSKPNVLVLFPRLARLVHCGDRYVVREWDRVMFSLFRAHYAPMTVSEKEFGKIRFNGGRAEYRGQEFQVLVLPCFTGLGEVEMKALSAFHQAGGHVVFTKSNLTFCDRRGGPSTAIRKQFEAMLGITKFPVVRRLNQGEEIRYGGKSYHARLLPEGVSEFDDSCLDFGDGLIVESTSGAGGRAVLIGFQAAALSCNEEMHRMHDTDTVALLDAVLSPVAGRAYLCPGGEGGEDYDVLGLVRHCNGEQMFTAHRRHGDRSVVRAGQSVVYIPSNPPDRNLTGCNVFVRHVEEEAHIVYNPFSEALLDCDVGKGIARVLTADGTHWWVHFQGSCLRMVLPPGRELRFRRIEFGSRDEALPADIEALEGTILEARVPVDNPGLLIVRATGPGHAAIRVSLSPDHGKVISAECPTSGKPAKVRTREADGRLWAEAEFEIAENIESDLVFSQSR